MGVPLHSGGYVPPHLGTTAESKRASAGFENATNTATAAGLVSRKMCFHDDHYYIIIASVLTIHNTI